MALQLNSNNRSLDVDLNLDDWLDTQLMVKELCVPETSTSSVNDPQVTADLFSAMPSETPALDLNDIPWLCDTQCSTEVLHVTSSTNNSTSTALNLPAPPIPNLYLNSEARWQAVLDRTPDAPFIYGVISTKICCRATCPARRPLRNNVKFYDSCAEAVAAGFRPCKRCKPDDAAGEAAEQNQAAAVERAKALIERESRKGEKMSLDKLASGAGLSTFYFHRIFKKRVGVTPEEWGKQCRRRGLES